MTFFAMKEVITVINSTISSYLSQRLVITRSDFRIKEDHYSEVNYHAGIRERWYVIFEWLMNGC